MKQGKVFVGCLSHPDRLHPVGEDKKRKDPEGLKGLQEGKSWKTQSSATAARGLGWEKHLSFPFTTPKEGLSRKRVAIRSS